MGLACVAACASNPARPSVKFPLEVPEPPPRVAMDPVPASPKRRPQRRRNNRALDTSGRGALVSACACDLDAAAAGDPPVAQTPEPARTPPPELRAGGPAGKTLTVAQVRERLVRTKQKLDSIDRRRLNAGKQADYDSARRFLEQADDAVKLNNLLLAESSVDKAETLADGLR